MIHDIKSSSRVVNFQHQYMSRDGQSAFNIPVTKIIILVIKIEKINIYIEFVKI